MRFFANIKQSGSEPESLMTLTFHTLGAEELVVLDCATWALKNCIAGRIALSQLH